VDDRGFKSRKAQEIFLFSKSQAHPASQSVCIGCSLSGGKVADADYLPPSSAEVMNVWSYTSTPSVACVGKPLPLRRLHKTVI